MSSTLPWTLPSLEYIRHHRGKYRGPISESNWVILKHLLVGAFPASPNDEETLENLYGILTKGITTFVCLQEEYNPNVTPQQYKNNIGIRPYLKDLLHITSKVELYRQEKNDPYFEPAIAKPDDIEFLHFPIKDCKTASDLQVYSFCFELARRLVAGEKLYIHCWGGHGRTGTIVSILLSILYKYDAQSTMHYCQFVHDLRKAYIQVPSPQTQTQRNQVCRIVDVIGRTSLYASSHQILPQFYHNQYSNSSNNVLIPKNIDKEKHHNHQTANCKDLKGEKINTKSNCSFFLYDEQKSSKSIDSMDTYYPDVYNPSNKYHFQRTNSTDSNGSSSSRSSSVTNSTSFPSSISEEVLSQVSSLTDSDESIDVESITTDIDIDRFDFDENNNPNLLNSGRRLSDETSDRSNKFFPDDDDERESNSHDMETIKK